MKTLLLILASFLVAATTIAAVSTGTDEQAQLPYWQWEDDVVSIRLVQRLPDQTRAYFAGRGFEDDDVKLIAEHCFFQTVFKNIAPPQSKQTIDYDLRKWYALVDGKRVELKLRGDWRSIWLGRQASAAQKIAFEWSLLPTQQRYLPADYNWGMTVFPIKHGTVFDLVLRWQSNGKEVSTTIRDIQCAKDVYIAPASQ